MKPDDNTVVNLPSEVLSKAETQGQIYKPLAPLLRRRCITFVTQRQRKRCAMVRGIYNVMHLRDASRCKALRHKEAFGRRGGVPAQERLLKVAE